MVVIGVIGTVEYSHAEIHHLGITDVYNFDNCFEDQRSQEYTDILYGDYIYLTNNANFDIKIKEQYDDFEDVYLTRGQTTLIIFHIDNRLEKLSGLYGENKYTIYKKTQKCNSDLIIRTHLNIPKPDETTNLDTKIEQKIDNLKEQYNTCFDEKETIKNDLSIHKEKFDILRTDYINTNFEIEKLKQEKADLIKKFKTLETQLQEN